MQDLFVAAMQPISTTSWQMSHKPVKKMPALFDEWLNSLPSKIAGIMKSRGFEQCKTVLSFTHFVNEHNNKNMNEWMKEHLSEEDFAYYINADRE